MESEIRSICRRLVLGRVADEKEMSDERLYEVIDQVLAKQAKETYLPLTVREHLRRSLFDSFRRLDILQELLEDDTITEIMVNGHETIFVERKGQITPWSHGFDSREKLEDVIQQIVAKVNRTVNESSPLVDARLPDGSRVNVVLPPISLGGPVLTIRKFAAEAITMEQLIRWESMDPKAAHVLQVLVQAKYNIFISGGTGSGKTTFLNALSQYIPAEERVITIEDSAELQLQNLPNLVRLEAREGAEEVRVTIRDLLRNSLRQNPDRIIVGEVRGSEADDMLSAMSVGQDGSLSTGHGNSPADMLMRLTTMVMMGSELPYEAVQYRIASALDILVHLGKLRDGSRKVLSIMEVGHVEEGKIKLHPLFQFEETHTDASGRIRGKWKQLADGLENRGKLSLAGLSDPL